MRAFKRKPGDRIKCIMRRYDNSDTFVQWVVELAITAVERSPSGVEFYRAGNLTILQDDLLFEPASHS